MAVHITDNMILRYNNIPPHQKKGEIDIYINFLCFQV